MTENTDYSQYKIVIVDSDNFFCQQVQAAMIDQGFQVEYERNARSGLKRIKSWKPHIVVSDYILHGTDYFDFASQVEAMPMKAHLVVVSSHHLDSQLLVQLTNLSRVSLTLQKPIKAGDLVKRIIQIVPTIDTQEEELAPEEDESDSEQDILDDEALQREVSRINFEGKELPRFVNSLKALTREARAQPHKSKYLREALEQSKRTSEEVRQQKLVHFEEPLERITKLLGDIINQGSLPSLPMWDLVHDELESLATPGKTIGTATLSAVDTVAVTSATASAASIIHEHLPEAPQLPTQAPPKVWPSIYQSASGVKKFLIIGDDPSQRLLDLGSRYGVSITIKDSLELARGACLSEAFDLILLLLPASLSGERAREAVVATHEMLQGIACYKTTPLAVLSPVESLHTRIVTAHLSNSYWISWSAMRKDDVEFLNLIALSGLQVVRPEVLIVDSDIADSENLLRELSRRCRKVDSVRDPNAVVKHIEENRTDIILISERIGDLSGLDLCRAIRKCLSFKNVALVLEITSANERTLKGAFLAGVDGVILKTESIESRAEIILTIYQKSLMSRTLCPDAAETSLQVTAEIRETLENHLNKAIEEQLPLTVCLIDLSEDFLPADYFAQLWNAKQKETATVIACSVHLFSSTQLLLSAVGLRKSTIQKALEEMIETDQMEVAHTAVSWRLRCRCYPDDALSLSDLLKFF